MADIELWGEPASLYQAVFENSRDAIGLSYAGTHVIVNPAYLKMFGYDSHQELEGRSILDLIAPSERTQILDYVRRRDHKENPPTFYETKGLCKDGREFDMEVTVSAYWKQEKNFTLVILRDITARKAAEAELKTSLQEREILLQEIHHRVKNNFQVMLSMLNLQMRKLNVPEAYDVLQTCHNRIRSMSLVHELLYDSQSVAEIDLRKYFKELARELSALYLHDLPLQLEFELEPLALSLEQAMPCGLLVTEILTNSFKYGFRSPYSGQPEVAIHLNSREGSLCLTLQDNGHGLPADFNFENSPGLGFRLIKSLVTQLNGRYLLESDAGVRWQIWFTPT